MNDPVSVSGNQSEALESFIGKWRARWPEWSVVEAFVPSAQRATAMAWAALQQELTDAAWGGHDPRPGELKLAWWQEELHGWAAGRRRHPLGSVLQREAAPWAGLAAMLPELSASRERARDLGEAFAMLDGFSAAAAAVESALFGPADDTRDETADALVVTATLLATRAVQQADACVPLSVLATPGASAALVRWREQLATRWPAPAAASTRLRRLWSALARARLRRPDPAQPLPAWQALAVAWRGARARRN